MQSDFLVINAFVITNRHVVARSLLFQVENCVYANNKQIMSLSVMFTRYDDREVGQTTTREMCVCVCSSYTSEEHF